MNDTPIHPHGPVDALADGLATVTGAWRTSPLPRRMTLFGVPGGLAVHSAIRLDDATLPRLDALGEPRLILVPNALHHSEAGFYALRHPGARVLVPAEARRRLSSLLPRIDGTLDDDWPRDVDAVLERAPLRGTRFAEVAFLHRPSRTLVLTDLCFHLASADLPPLARLLMRLNGAVDRLAVTRLARLAFIQDRRALARSLESVLAWDFDRVIVSHGRVLESGGHAAFERAMRPFTGARQGAR